ERHGANVLCVATARAALELLSEGQFDVLLSDIGMPDVDGYEFIQKVRGLGNDRSRSIPAIAITAYARPDDRQKALLAGYQMQLAKPIDAPELVAAIASFRSLRLSRHVPQG